VIWLGRKRKSVYRYRFTLSDFRRSETSASPAREAEIRHNGQQIAELKANIARLDEKVERLQARLDSQFRWIVALLFPIILGVVAIIIQNLLRP